MDATDLAIFRYMFPGGEAWCWASHWIVDPRISPRQIATKLGLSEVTIRNRLARLRARGIFPGDEVWFNPSLFQVEFETVEIPLRDSAHGLGLQRQLSRIDGVVSSTVMFDDHTRRLRVTYVSDSSECAPSRLDSIIAQSRSFPFGDPFPETVSGPPLQPPSTLDWRVLESLRSHPEWSIAAHSDYCGVSAKTFGRRYSRLLDSRSILWIRKVDFAQFPVVTCDIHVDRSIEFGRFIAALEGEFPGYLPMMSSRYRIEPGSSSRSIGGIFFTSSPAACDELTERLAALPGVTRVVSRFFGRSQSYPDWYDAQLYSQMHSFGGGSRTILSADGSPAVCRSQLGIAPSHISSALNMN